MQKLYLECSVSGSVNKVILVGRLSADPEARAAPNGDKIVKFRLITSKSWKDKQSGERKEKADGHNIVVFNSQLAEIAHSYLKKGSNCYVEGELQNRKYQVDGGVDRWVTEVVLDRYNGQITLLDPNPNGQSENRASPPQRGQNSGQAPANKYPGRASHAQSTGGWGSDLDDEIPGFD